MPVLIRIPDHLSAALDATSEAAEHGRAYANAALVAEALAARGVVVDPPLTPREAKAAGGQAGNKVAGRGRPSRLTSP